MSKREIMRWAGSCAAVAMLFGSAACNQVTGVGDLKVDPLGGGSDNGAGGLLAVDATRLGAVAAWDPAWAASSPSSCRRFSTRWLTGRTPRTRCRRPWRPARADPARARSGTAAARRAARGAFDGDEPLRADPAALPARRDQRPRPGACVPVRNEAHQRDARIEAPRHRRGDVGRRRAHRALHQRQRVGAAQHASVGSPWGGAQRWLAASTHGTIMASIVDAWLAMLLLLV